MKTYTSYDQIPKSARYLGSEDGAGFMGETLAEFIAQSINPVRLRDDDGTYSYFEVAA
jgi:hypothetical protein